MESKQSSTDGAQDETRQMGSNDRTWLFPLLLAVLLLGLVAVGKWAPQQEPRQHDDPTADWTPSPQPVGETVSLTIDFGNGVKKEFAALPWQAEMTVADLLEAAREFRPGIEFTQIGSGEVGFLRSLDGLANEGAGGRNWLYRVNHQHGHVSFCVEKIDSGEHVLWSFTDELYNDETGE